MRNVNVLPRPMQQAAPADLDPGRRLGRDVGLLRAERLRVRRARRTTGTCSAERTSATTGAGSRRTARTRTHTGSRSCSSSASATPTPRPTSCTGSRPSTSSTDRSMCTPATRIRPATSPRRRSERGTSRRCARWPAPSRQKHDLTWDEMVEKGYVVIGSPDTVRETLEEVAKTFNCGHLLTAAALRQHERRAHSLQHEAVRRQGRARAARHLRRRRRSAGGRRTRRGLTWQPTATFSTSSASRAIPRPRPCSRSSKPRAGTSSCRASRASTPAGTSSRRTTTSAGSRCSGTRSTRPTCACRARSSARPSAACSRSTSRPTGPRRCGRSPCSPRSASSTRHNQGLDLYAVPTPERMAHLFAKGVPEPFVDRFGELGPDDGPVARYLSDVAAANLLWPLGDRGQAGRLHRVTLSSTVAVGRPGRAAAPGPSGEVGRGRHPRRDDRRRRPSARVGCTRARSAPGSWHSSRDALV